MASNKRAMQQKALNQALQRVWAGFRGLILVLQRYTDQQSDSKNFSKEFIFPLWSVDRNGCL